MLILSIILFMAVMFWPKHRATKPAEVPPAVLPQSAPVSKPVSTPVSSREEDLYDDLLSSMADGPQEKIFFQGTELIKVRGESFEEDPQTRKVLVKGLEMVEMLDGSILLCSSDSILRVDQVSGAAQIEGGNVTFVAPKKDR